MQMLEKLWERARELFRRGDTLTLDTQDHGHITRIPPGHQEIQVEFVAMSDANASFNRLMEILDNVKKQSKLLGSKAVQFRQKVKDEHRIPALEAGTYKALGAKNITLSLQPSGNYKITAVDFDDESSWEKGEVYE